MGATTDLAAWVEETKKKRKKLIEASTEVTKELLENRFGVLMGYGLESEGGTVRVVVTLDINMGSAAGALKGMAANTVKGSAKVVPPKIPLTEASKEIYV